jgi:hypothetical protein
MHEFKRCESVIVLRASRGFQMRRNQLDILSCEPGLLIANITVATSTQLRPNSLQKIFYRARRGDLGSGRRGDLV